VAIVRDRVGEYVGWVHCRKQPYAKVLRRVQNELLMVGRDAGRCSPSARGVSTDEPAGSPEHVAAPCPRPRGWVAFAGTAQGCPTHGIRSRKLASSGKCFQSNFDCRHDSLIGSGEPLLLRHRFIRIVYLIESRSIGGLSGSYTVTGIYPSPFPSRRKRKW
jgi:hypothetical protein